MSKKVIMAGGGTGGHIFPAIAIANALKKLEPHCEVLFVGAKGKMEMEKVPQAGYEIEALDIVGFNRSSLMKNFSLPFKLMSSFLRVRDILNHFKPDAVVGVGGYSSFPVLRYAQQRDIPTFIHESNSYAGRSNILLGKKATKVFVASGGMARFFPQEKIVLTGNPVRSNIAEARVTREEGIHYFGLDPQYKTVLSVGGSLGASSINLALAGNIDEFEKHGLQLIWQTGKPFAERGRQAAEGRSNIWAGDFITSMEYALAAGDVVISRAGAMAIAELCVTAKPTILVPYPFAAEDHQTVNARTLVENDAGLMIHDSQVNESLVPMIIELAADEEKQQELKVNISKMAFVDADIRVAGEILKTLDEGR